MAGTLQYLDQAVLSQACIIALMLRQRLEALGVSYIEEANMMIPEQKRLNPMIKFQKPKSITNVETVALSDGSHSVTYETYGQSGILRR